MRFPLYFKNPHLVGMSAVPSLRFISGATPVDFLTFCSFSHMQCFIDFLWVFFQLQRRLEERKTKRQDEAAALFSLGERQKTVLEKSQKVCEPFAQSGYENNGARSLSFKSFFSCAVHRAFIGENTWTCSQAMLFTLIETLCEPNDIVLKYSFTKAWCR